MDDKKGKMGQMKIFYFLVTLTLSTNLWAEVGTPLLPEAEFMTLVVCETMEAVENQIEFIDKNEFQDFLELRGTYQENLSGIEMKIKSAMDEDNWNRASILCARADEVSHQFQKNCEPTPGQLLFDNQAADELCSPLRFQ